MLRRILKNSPLYLLTLSNLVYCVRHGFNWVAYVALSLSAVCLIFDIVRGIQGGKDK